MVFRIIKQGFLVIGVIMTPHAAKAENQKNEPAQPITVALESNIRSYDPRYALDANSQYMENLIHCSLIDFNDQGEVITQVASQIPTWITPTTLSISIRNDIRFSNGNPLTTDDVLELYKALSMNPQLPRSGSFQSIKSIKKNKSDQLIIELKEPDASFISNLIVGIIPKANLKELPIDPLNTPSCGPYLVRSIGVDQIRLTPNKMFSLSKVKSPHDVIFKIVKSEKTRFAKLRAGEIDISQNNINRDLIDDVQLKYPQLTLVKSPALKTTYLGFNMNDPVAGNIHIRKAMDLAINRQAIIDLLLGGLATPAYSMLTQEDFYRNTEIGKTNLDISKANQILDRAGFPRKNGTYRFSISYKTTTNSTRINIARAIASQLKKIGIQVIIEPMEWGRFKQDVEKGRVQMWSLSWIGFKDPDILRYAFSSASFPPNGGNRGRYKNSRIDELTMQGLRTTERQARKKIYDEIQSIIAKEKPYIFLWHEQNFAVLRSNLKNFKLYRDGRLFSLTQVVRMN